MFVVALMYCCRSCRDRMQIWCIRYEKLQNAYHRTSFGLLLLFLAAKSDICRLCGMH